MGEILGRCLLVQAGDAPDDVRASAGNVPDWFTSALDAWRERLDVVRPFAGEALPEPQRYAAAVVSGSWAMVSHRESWSEATAQWLRQAVEAGLPVFGVCYGHQLLAHALGGEVDDHPDGLELGTLDIRLHDAARQDDLLQGLPPVFRAHLTHRQSVLRLPPGAVALARSAHDPHQIVRYAPHVVSTQFHPEFSEDVIRACIDRAGRNGVAVDAIREAVAETAVARGLLQRFVGAALSNNLATSRPASASTSGRIPASADNPAA